MVDLIEWMERTTWQAVMLVGSVLLIKAIFGRWLNATAHYFLWIPVLIHLATPMLIAGPRSLYSTVEYIPGVMDFVRFYHHESRGGEHFLHGLVFVWAIGVVVYAARLIGGHWKFKRLIRNARQVEDESVLRMLEACRKALVITKPARLVESRALAVPAVTGLFRPTLVLPEGLIRRIDSKQLECVILHELAHFKNGDLWTLWLTRLVDVVHWFNPVARFATRSIVRACERACDARVLECYGSARERRRYGEMLLNLSDALPANTHRVPAALFMFGRNGDIKRRIRSITRFKASWMNKRKWAFLLLLPLVIGAQYKPAYYCVSKSLGDVVNVEKTPESDR